MKKLILSFLSILILFSPIIASAQTESQYRLGQEQTKGEAQFIFRNSVILEGQIKNDVFIFANEIRISGLIEGNLFCLSEKLVIEKSAKIKGSVFALSSMADLSGLISGNVFLGASEISTSSNLKIDKELNFIAQRAIIKGTLLQQVRGYANEIKLEKALFFNNVLIKGKYISYDSDTIVKGKLTYYSPFEILSEEGGKAQINQMEWKKTTQPTFSQRMIQNITKKLVSLLSILIIGFLWLLLWKDKYKSTMLSLRERLLPALGWGIILLLILPSLLLILAISILGIPLGIIISVFAIFWAYISPLVVGGLIGNFLLQLVGYDGEKYPYLALSLGVIVLSILFVLPGAGWLFVLITTILGFGTLLVGRKEILGLKF